MNKTNFRHMRASNSGNLSASIRKLNVNKTKSKLQNMKQDSIIVIDDVVEQRMESPKNTQKSTLNNSIGVYNTFPTKGAAQRQLPASSLDNKRKKVKLENNKESVVFGRMNRGGSENNNEIDAKNNSNNQKYYKTSYGDVDPIDYFLANNPGKVYEDALKQKLNNKKSPDNCELTEEDQESIVNMLKDFYEEKSDQYYLCSCPHCSCLTLPFLIRKDIEDPKEIETLQQKHYDYYKKHLPETFNQQANQPRNLHINNIFFKKMQSYSDSDLGLSVLNTKAGESKVELTLQKDQNFVQIDKTETEEIDPFEYGIELSGEILKLDTSAGIVGYSMEYIAKYNLFIVGTKDGSILVYDSSSFHLLEKLASVHKGWIISLTYSPALNLLFSTSSDRLIKIFQPESKNIIELTKLEGHKDNVNAVLVDEKNLLLFSCGRDPDIKIWDLDSYSLKDIISTGEGKMGCAILNIEEKNCIGVSFFTGEIRFYNIETKLCIFTLETGVSSYYINSLLYLPKKKFIIAQISSKEIKIWKMINEELNEFTVYGTIKSEGHANFVYVDKKEESIVFACDKPFLDVFDLNSLLRKNKIHFSETPLKNSNGLLLIPSLSKIIVSAWNSPHLYILKYDSLSV